MLRRQEPDSDLVAGNLVGQQLANLSLKAGRIAGFSALFAPGTLGGVYPMLRTGESARN